MNGLIIQQICCIFADCMEKGKKETFTIRVISTSFTILALAVFKPFGLETWQWQAYAHLLAMWMLGVATCFVTEGILKYLIKMPRSYEHGIGYIIRRNLWFQVINTLLITLMICLYRHFLLSDLVESNRLSWINFFETLLIFAFCSFAIGLYWRFKFRSRFLAAELEETRQLNEQLQKLQQTSEQRKTESHTAEEIKTEEAPLPPTNDLENKTSAVAPNLATGIVLTGTTKETVSLHVSDLLYVEAVGNYVKVYRLDENGNVRNDLLRATSKQIEEQLSGYPMIVRCHRAFLVNLQQVEKIESKAGVMQLIIKHCRESLPVSRSNMSQVKEAIKGL